MSISISLPKEYAFVAGAAVATGFLNFVRLFVSTKKNPRFTEFLLVAIDGSQFAQEKVWSCLSQCLCIRGASQG